VARSPAAASRSASSAARAAAAADPADDLHGSADYKREMVAVFTRRALAIAAARAGGVEPAARWPHAVVA
jgi:carbon-monoxide dehydrogenase medium subunit